MTMRRLNETSHSKTLAAPACASCRASSALPKTAEAFSTMEATQAWSRGRASSITAGPAWLCVAVTITRAAGVPWSAAILVRIAAVSSAEMQARSSWMKPTSSAPLSKTAARAKSGSTTFSALCFALAPCMGMPIGGVMSLSANPARKAEASCLP